MHIATPLVDIATIVGKTSWILRNDSVRVALTQQGGHMAPVTFFPSNGIPIEPYYVSPWGADDLHVPEDEPCTGFIRGDFFCFPFGYGGEHDDVRHVLHGEPSFQNWNLDGVISEQGVSEFRFSIQTQQPRGMVTKKLFLVDGQTVVYSQHELNGYNGSFPAGHHAMLAMPDEAESVLVGLSAYRYGYTWPSPFGDPATLQSYYALSVKQRFERLSAVPLAFKDPSVGSCEKFPTRRGYTDALACISNAGDQPAWTTATFTTRGFIWFALKDARVFPLTLMWIANRGRHASPWLGREHCLGLEDVRAFFGEGLRASVESNFLSEDGVPTTFDLNARAPLRLNYIQGVIAVPPSFGRVTNAIFRPNTVQFVDERGVHVDASVDHNFLQSNDAPVRQ